MKNLANELRPKTLNDVIGQPQVTDLLKKVAQNQLHFSFIFYGESGTGKTSAAVALANDLGLSYGFFNATIDSKKDLQELLETKDIIILDEIHRLNKDKQDILLSYLEADKIIVYATTTENPYFRVNPALRSRMQIRQFNKISEEDIFLGLKKVKETYFLDLKISDQNLKNLVKVSNGDYRSAINNLQLISLVSSKDEEITETQIKKIIPNINFYSDKDADAHYHFLSAFHKSLRGSDVDAALYWGTLILKSGDYHGLFRRLTCAAYEDVGLADSNLPMRIDAAFDAVEKLGFPEANLPIYFAIITVALAPKSNTVVKSIGELNNFVDQGNVFEVPKHLKDAHYASAKYLGDGLGYKYPHDFPNSLVKQQYLPNEIKNKQFIDFSDNDSKKFKEWYQELKRIQNEGE
ncbi:replication-associated recombination protein A [Mycoplasmopsis columbinasalis]|uniref:ATPase n=1 Tax=Mycoplasmopsis columbinasalis TaxID=114880 RepID=A0A449BAI5_9BACT|nr:replication-associated recombination protein A [Mycoplasmopsis columbinasalis]VEU78214.1 ATPase [Mycoplasmopsis columbinasalis]